MLDINKLIHQEIKIKDEKQFNELLEYFLSEEKSSERWFIYDSYMMQKGLHKLNEAKLQIIKILFSDYINHAINDYQNIINSHEDKNSDEYNTEINAINKHIENLAKFSSIFKAHDTTNFNEYILQSVKDINMDEVFAIFDKVQMSHEDIGTINDAINKVLQSQKKYNVENFTKDFINHEFTDLFVLPRKKSYIFNPENFNKYSNLANAIIKHKLAEHIEGFDGGMSYLLSLDLVYGLNNLKDSDNPNYKRIGNLLARAEQNKFDNYDLKELMFEAVKQSKNIKENHKGEYNKINNSGNALKLVGPVDRLYEFDNNVRLFLHTVSGNCEDENNQVGRVQQIYKNVDNINQHSIQIGTRPPINRKLNEYSNDALTISRREQLILSHMRNFAYMTNLVATGKKDISVLEHAPIELWASAMDASKNYMNDYLSCNDKINSVGNAWLFLVDKTNILQQFISTNDKDPKHEHIINPLLMFVNAVIRLNKKEPEKYNQLLSNIYHVLKNKEYIFENGHPSIATNYEHIIDYLNSLKENNKIADRNFGSLTLINDVYQYTDSPLAEVIYMSDSNKLVANLKKFFASNALTFKKLSDEDLLAFRSLEHSIINQVLPEIKKLGLSDVQSIYETQAAQSNVSLIGNIVDKICDPDINKRHMWGCSSPEYSPEEKKLYNMYIKRDDDNSINRDILEILGKISFLTHSRLRGVYGNGELLHDKLGIPRKGNKN